MKTKVRDYYFCLPVLLYIVTSVLPIISRNIGTATIIAVLLLQFIPNIRKIIVLEPNVVLLFFTYVIYIIIQYFRVTYVTSIGNLYENILFVLPILYFPLYRVSTDRKKIIVISFIGLQTYVAIDNIVLLANKPYLSKYLTGGVSYVVSDYQHSNLGSVTNVFTSVCVVFISLLIYKNFVKKIYRIALICSIIINSLFVFYARSTLCVLVLFWGIIFFIGKERIKNQLLFVFIILLSLIAIIVLLSIIREYIANSDMAYEYKNRFLNIIDLISGNDDINSLGFINGRSEDYLLSIKTFLKNPLFGVGMIYSSDIIFVGMHSEIFDFMARYGLIGGILFVSLLKYYFHLQNNTKQSEYKTIIVIIVLYSLFNPCISKETGIIFFIILPCLTDFYKQERYNYDSDNIK